MTRTDSGPVAGPDAGPVAGPVAGQRSTAVLDGLTGLFAPRGIAVVGVSRDPRKLGSTLARSLGGFAERGGHLALVNGRVPGLHASVAAAAQDGPIDLAMICVPAPASPDALAEAAAAGARAAVVCGGGFAESGAEGVGHQERLAAVVAGTEIRLLGPNTSGFLAPHAGVTASFVPGVAQVRPGRVAVVAASGGVNHALAFLLTEAGHGVSLAVGLGNAVDVSAPDVLDHLVDDPATGAVALHIESVADGPRLVAAVSRLAETRPVVALVVGRHDIGAFARSHTGALATSWRTTRAALAQAGAVLVGDERELVDAVGALSVRRARPARWPGVGVVTAQAGPGLLLLDDLHGRDIRVPELAAATQDTLATLLPPLTFQRNPVDTGRPGPEFGRVLRAVAEDPEVDVVAAYALHEPDAVDLLAAVREGAVPDVPVVLGVGGAGAEVARSRADLLDAGVAVAADPRGVAAGIGALLADARARARRAGTDTSDAAPTGTDTSDAAPTGIAGPHDEHQAKLLLDRLGVITPTRRPCATRAEAHAALSQLGGPVAVKVLDAAVLHKTDIGGVHLGVRDPAELDAALDAIDKIGGSGGFGGSGGSGAIGGSGGSGGSGGRRYLVEAMAAPGVDLVLGARRDPVFGPIVVLGLGGTAAEALSDVAIRLAPVAPADAADMVSELSGRALLDGWRGGPVCDPAALGRVSAALGAVLVANPGIDELEVNPLRLTDGGLVALDAVVIPATVVEEVSDAQPDQ